MSKICIKKTNKEFLQEMLDAMENLEFPRLIAGRLIFARPNNRSFDVCALGSVVLKRDIEMSQSGSIKSLSNILGISQSLTKKILYINDKEICNINETPENRFIRVRHWAESQVAIFEDG